MFNPNQSRIFALPPGTDFPAELVSGLIARMAAQPPQAMAGVTVYLNTARMRRRVIQLFAAQGARFLPRLLLVTDLATDPRLALPALVPPLRRRLQMAELIAKLLDAQPDLAPRAALYDLSDSLATLLDEMQGEGVSAEAISALDVSNHSKHWERTQTFLRIVTPLFADASDAESRQRLAVQQLAQRWHSQPPTGPVLIAGSTGSRGTTALFMQAVAQLPQGAIVLPGYDFETPPAVWQAMDDALTAEDHPQYRFRHLMDLLGIAPDAIQPWRTTAPPDKRRNLLISLSLRPAPVTDQWLVEGPNLPDLCSATQDLSLIEAASPRAEALAIALILRDAAASGTTAALITPDRNLSRQVTAALDRWAILPDDSAGRPLAMSAPGRFLRHTSALLGQRLTADSLLTVLKHPLTASGAMRSAHTRLTRDLELKLRKSGPAFPTDADLLEWAAARKDDALPWARFIADTLQGLDEIPRRPLADHVAQHRTLSESLARGLDPIGSGELWVKAAGIEALALMETLATEAPYGGTFSAAEYCDLFEALVNKGEVREPVQAHPNIMIWGTLEARVQGADLVILGGLNDGIWPKLPEPDPWLNRSMRKKAALLLPERQIGLSAHDYQQAIAAPRVILSRAVRNAEAETVPSRWLNRLMNLMDGLPQKNGGVALAEMRARGAKWLALARAVEQPTAAQKVDPRLRPAKRPAPQPPVSARPPKLSLTNIERLIRDPYAIYARYILRLNPLDPLHQSPDARDRGIIVHDVLERFVKTRPLNETRAAARARLLGLARIVLAEESPFPAARALWLAKLDRAADHFLTQDSKHGGTSLALETKGALKLENLAFTLFGTPDRIDRLPDGTLHLIDYKTGSAPKAPQQKQYAKQLLLAAVMANRGGFADLGPSDVAKISYIGLGASEDVVETEITDAILTEHWEKLLNLIARYLRRNTGYTARRALFETRYPGDYDHLSRFGEWEMSDRAVPEHVGPDAAGPEPVGDAE
ncbi:double-strand break repair protein AddB [Cypionkella aquatica]|uniref:Double-strand break repair protein AddB n=1 Tax=Cypionkella aquatica TaxID=1756042 RepID=A0AA37TR73_9RHOB|nr:double-strand break repair protein AddB [Cypionkella aquatica]GLS86234.1 double-strand break repair protein AddB [Cypionkella aquatica]